MRKLSEAEKKRRKEARVTECATHILNIIWACRDSATYNGSSTEWTPDKMDGYLKMYRGFVRGLVLLDGLKWQRKLNTLFAEYEQLHGPLF